MIVVPRIPARSLRGDRNSARQLAVAPPQPPTATRKPAVATADRALSSAAPVVPSVAVKQAEKPASTSTTKPAFFEMAQFGAPHQTVAAGADGLDPSGLRLLLARLAGDRRVLAYAVLGLSLVALQFSIPRPHAAARSVTRPVIAAALAVASAQAPEGVIAHEQRLPHSPP